MLIVSSNIIIQNQWRDFFVNVAPQHRMQPLDILRRKTAILCVLKHLTMGVHFARNIKCGSWNNPHPVKQVCVRVSLCVLYYQ